jgi:predicted NAD/FAD-binding protein
MLADPTALERELLGPFHYKPNTVTVHTDASLMPRHKRAWAAFNCRVSLDTHGQPVLHQNYYANFLQKLTAERDYFMAIGNDKGIDPTKIIKKFTFHHVIYSVEATAAQSRLGELNENGNTYFCGSYFRNGFHEDALLSAINVARGITGKNIWGDTLT